MASDCIESNTFAPSLNRSVRQSRHSRLRPETVQVKPDLKVGAADVLYVGHSVGLCSGTHVGSDIRSDSYSHVIIQFASQKLFQFATSPFSADAGADFFPSKDLSHHSNLRFGWMGHSSQVDTFQTFIPDTKKSVRHMLSLDLLGHSQACS